MIDLEYFIKTIHWVLRTYSKRQITTCSIDMISIIHGKKLWNRDAQKWPQTDKSIFIVVEENFEFQCFEMAQNEQIQLLFSQIIFTMVEENFEFLCFEMAQNEQIQLLLSQSVKLSSPWLKKVLNFDALKWLRTNKFNFYFLKVSNHLHHD